MRLGGNKSNPELKAGLICLADGQLMWEGGG